MKKYKLNIKKICIYTTSGNILSLFESLKSNDLHKNIIPIARQ